MKRESIRVVISRNIRKYRSAKGLSQEKLSVLADLHHSTVGFIERMETNTSVETLEKIAITLGIGESQLMDRTTKD